ncbi:MAG: hypothetical protein ABEJ42_08685 [Halobacteriaceae archaeon]
MRYQPEQSGPSFQEVLAVIAVGVGLVLVGLVGLYFGIVMEKSGPLRIAGSVVVIGIGCYLAYGALVGKDWVGKIRPSPRPQDEGRRRR